jgi:ATP-dependent Lhr-like helicase
MHSFDFQPAVAQWFASRFGTPTKPQARGWPAIQSGQHTLISAPTGSGKTLAAFLAALDQLFRDATAGCLPDETRVVYVSPLKALSNDIHKNLEEPLREIRALLADGGNGAPAVRAEVRTGDTPAAKRQAIARKPPHILVTTPESFYLLLTSESGRRMLRTVRTLIVDEIHAVVAGRRGSHLALSMERLEALVKKPIQRIGLSATQKPIEEVARFLVGSRALDGQGKPQCAIIDAGHAREIDLAIELPGSPLQAVMALEVWAEVYSRLAQLIEEHRTTLVFVNTRRLAERVTFHLTERLGADKVTSHHGSLSARLRLDAEDRLKKGQLKALVATSSLELGIDIGSVDLVCQLGSTRSISALLQRIGRAEHKRGGLPKGRLFPLTRDELVECAALLRSVRRGELDRLQIPEAPLDVLAQQIVACAAGEDWAEDQLFALVRSTYPYRNLRRKEFDDVVAMLSEGFSTKRGRRGALIHHDAVNHRIRGRRGARMIALTSGGAIPENADYRVVLEPTETFIGTVNEDFAIESLPGDIFQLGNASWKILRVNSGMVRVSDAQGQPPSIPFWLGEGPARTEELSRAVSDLRVEVEKRLSTGGDVRGWLLERGQSDQPAAAAREDARLTTADSLIQLPAPAAEQLADYFAAAYRTLGAIPSQETLVMERFFDESGGMQLVIHSLFGSRVNRAWGLALRKRFCRTFNFELQAAATDDAIVLSLGAQHSFPLEEVFQYLNSKTVRDLLVQALLDAPMFTIRWRWNATRALAVLRQRGSRKNPAPLQRMEAEDLLAAVFPDQLACLENIVGDRSIPDHPLVTQTIQDCLVEAMDIDGLVGVLKRIEEGTIRCVARDLPEPSPLAHEILNARPYAFLDNAPLEERRTRAVYTRRTLEASSEADLGKLDVTAIERVRQEAWPQPTNAEEMHDALLWLGVITEEEAREQSDPNAAGGGWISLLNLLADAKRAGQFTRGQEGRAFWIAAERLPMLEAIYTSSSIQPPLAPPQRDLERRWERSEALRELLRGRLEASGPVTVAALADILGLSSREIEAALVALEAEGFVLRGRFHPQAKDQEWCDRRLLARIHRLTINRLRAEIQPVSMAEFYRFLLAWQRVDVEHRVKGLEGLEAVLELLDGYEVAAGSWEPDVIAARLEGYDPEWLDRLCLTGRVGWGRLTPPQTQKARAFSFGPVRSSPVSIFHRDHLPAWLELCEPTADESPLTRPSPSAALRRDRSATLSPLVEGRSRQFGAVQSTAIPGNSRQALAPDTRRIRAILAEGGASFFTELVRRSGLLPSQVEQALGELVALGVVTADSFDGLRALLVPSDKRPTFSPATRRRRHETVSQIEFAGRWSLLRHPPTQSLLIADNEEKPTTPASESRPEARRDEIARSTRAALLAPQPGESAIETYARVLLRRYGVVFRLLLEREPLNASWYEIGRVCRRLEARGEIRGGYFVAGASGEQFALPEAVGLLRSIRKAAPGGELVCLSATDPLNLVGILTPGRRIGAIAANRILLKDGLPIAALEAGQVIALEDKPDVSEVMIENLLKVGKLPPLLRPYYG